jgi:NADPH:quinone reductase-like Zn-dependent oxidoreductase
MIAGTALKVRHPGDLTSLTLAPRSRRPPAAGEIEIRVEAAGVNFADVLVAFGMYNVESGAQPELGLDCAGTVERVGAGVARLRPGDRVAAVGEGCFAGYVTVPAELVMRIPPSMAFAAAATMPIAFLTAWYALVHRADLASGESVLIHSAAGGVGGAAVQIARLRGARVLATAGTEGKRRYLQEQGISDVWNSRAPGFGDGAREATGGQGVDVVLNSLPGEAVRAGLEALSVGGRFLELAKRDIYADAPLGLYPFRRNISLHSIDLMLLIRASPGLIRRLNDEIEVLLTEGALLPLPHVIFPVEQAPVAFRAVASGQLVGKVVLTPENVLPNLR